MPALARVIEESDKSELNARGRYVAAGQRIGRDGNVTGSPARTATISFWMCARRS
jgi:phage terminase large subunit GpA-like protein